MAYNNVMKQNTIGAEELVLGTGFIKAKGVNANTDIKTVDQLTAIKKDKTKVLNLTSAKKMISALGKIGYASGSAVGLITVLVSNTDMLQDNTLNKQFLKAGTNEIDMFKFGKLFLKESNSESCTGYNRVFDDNKLVCVTDGFDIKQYVLAGFKSDIETFANRVMSMSAGHQEDLVKIGQDLEVVGRILQEVEIDSAKDASKKDGVKEISQIMSPNAAKILSNNLNFYNNFEDIIDQKRLSSIGKASKNLVFDFKVTRPAITMNSLYKFIDEETKRFLADKAEGLEQYEIEKEIANIKNKALAKAIIVDPAGQIAIDLTKQYCNELSKLVEHYKNNTDMSLFNRYDYTPNRVNEPIKRFAHETEAQAITNLQRIIIKIYEMINSTFTHKSVNSSERIALAKAEELAAVGRRIIYTMGTQRGFAIKDVFALAVSLADKTIGNLGGLKTTNFKFRPMELMFATELKWDLAPEAMDTAVLELDLPLGLELELNTKFDMEDGQVIVEIDGEEEVINCLSDDEYTGEILVTLDENDEVVFKAVVNPYEFEEIDFLLYDKLIEQQIKDNADTTVDDLAEITSAGDITAFVNSMEVIEAKNTSKLSPLETTTYFEDMSNSLAAWTRLATLTKNNAAFEQKFMGLHGGVMVYAQNGEKIKMLGRGLAQNNSNANGLAQYLITPVGAIMIINK